MLNAIYSIQSHYKGNHNRRGAAATFVEALNRVDVVAFNTIFALRLSNGRTAGRTDSQLRGWSVGRTDDRAGRSEWRAASGDALGRNFLPSYGKYVPR